MTKTTAVVAMACLILVDSSHACSCAHVPVSERFDEVPYVFSAEIIAAELVADPVAELNDSFDNIKIVLGPRREYKNDSSAVEFLYTDSSEASCGVRVTIGARHTFMVDGDGRVHLCGSLVERDEQPAFHQLLLDRNLIESP